MSPTQQTAVACTEPAASTVLCLADIDAQPLQQLLARYGLRLQRIGEDLDIPGSFWGDSEAGVIENSVLARADTPIHSILHEACHYICMDSQRRAGLHTNAGGDYAEENAVCYLQILLAAQLPAVGSQRLLRDMDSWGYSFRLGSSARWFHEDAEDARAWLRQHGLIDKHQQPSWRLRC